MRRSMADIQSPTAEIRRAKKKERKKERKKKPHGKNIMSASATQGGHNKEMFHSTSGLQKSGTKQKHQTDPTRIPSSMSDGAT